MLARHPINWTLCLHPLQPALIPPYQLPETTLPALLLQLSDIHLTAKEDPVLSRVEKICRAVRPFVAQVTGAVVVVSGDVAFSGTPEQFETGRRLLERVRRDLSRLVRSDVKVVVVPGNHDCYFPADSTARDLILSSITRESAASPSIQDAVMGVQDGFFEHLKPFLPASLGSRRSDRLYYEYEARVGSHRYLFRCYNTAWTSKLREQPGQMRYFPGEVPRAAHDHDFVVSVLHHPPHWLAPADVRMMREHWLSTSDMVLTGHEHEQAQMRTADFDGGAFTHIEGGVLQDNEDDDRSTFNVILIDPVGARSRTIRFEWRGDLYHQREDSQSDWVAFQRNPELKGSRFSLTSEFLDVLEDPGATFTSGGKGRLTLTDLFVMPNVASIDESESGEAEDPVDLVVSCPRVAISGDERSGKTTLAKRLVPLLLQRGLVPVLIDGKHLKGGNPERTVARVIDGAVAEQYGAAAVEPFRQAETDGRVVIVDDLEDSANDARGRQRLLRALDDAGYEHVVVFVGAALSAVDIAIQADGDHDAAAPYVLTMIQPFGHKLRDDLIERWFTSYDLSGAERDRKIHRAHRMIDGVVGQNFVPAYPIIILSILQGLEAGTPLDMGATTFGYFYEILIHEALGARRKQDASSISMLLSFLSFVAHRLHVDRVRLLSSDEVQDVHAEYKAWANMDDRDFPLSPTLKRLVDARLIDVSASGDLRFRYPYVYYYSAARYYSDRLASDPVAQSEVEALCDRLYEEEAANILLFLAHLSKSPFVVDNVLRSAQELFKEVPPADLRDDQRLFDGLNGQVRSVVKDLELAYVESNTGQNRKRVMEERDRSEQEGAVLKPTPERPLALSPGPTFDTDEDWREIVGLATQINVAFKAVQIMGQILKNNPGDISGDTKRKLAEECYSLSLRAAQAFYTFLAETRAELIEGVAEMVKAQYKRVHEARIGEKDLIERAQKSVVGLAIAFSYGVIRHIAQAVGIPRGLNATYKDVLAGAKGNPNYTLVNASISLDHTEGFPQGEIERTGKEMEPYFVGTSILKRMVTNHFYLYEVDRRIREETCSKLGIQVHTARTLDKRRKHKLKGPQ